MFIKDPCGIACIIVTYLAVFYADYVVVKWIILQTMVNSLWGAFNLLLFNSILFLLCMSHIRAVFTDPGTIPLHANKMEFSDIHAHSTELGCDLVNWTICTRCETYRPPRAHHCRICKRCILRMDHHCPWINNCVGERNQKFFLQFLIYVGALAGYSVILIVFSWLSECNTCSDDIITKQSRICQLGDITSNIGLIRNKDIHDHNLKGGNQLRTAEMSLALGQRGLLTDGIRTYIKIPEHIREMATAPLIRNL
ncbi:hypothetical protein HHI36_010398 [Cryptolaemus montrouzieri]|uniref:Palmitoyltransferase n=1 Tax=Cryptolaemus montrouzieri TaxID=559131 RepID=A0ABD2MJC9_9CUCU